MRRLAVVLVLVLLLAACGGSGGGSSGGDEAQVTKTYEKFFSGKTKVSEKVALLQNGPQYASVISSFSSFPGAKTVSVDVKSVTLQGAKRAKVVYVVKVGGQSIAGTQTGSAVKQSGQWKVGDESLCRLVELSGTAPPQCTK